MNTHCNKKELTGLTLLLIVLTAGVSLLLSQPPLPQDLSYHQFVDSRTLFNIANFNNVISNLPFLLVGTIGLYKLLISRQLTILNELKTAYIILFSASCLVAFGSAYYHLSPDNLSLIWDRTPMSIAFMSLYAIIIGEFISTKLGKQLLLPLILAGLTSVIYWYLTESWNAGDLRFYILVQFIPILTMPVILIFFKSAFDNQYGYWWLLSAYFIAKILEHFDAEVYELSLIISGHSLKHVFAALGLYLLIKHYHFRKHG